LYAAVLHGLGETGTGFDTNVTNYYDVIRRKRGKLFSKWLKRK
jgi:hypothetical protein